MRLGPPDSRLFFQPSAKSAEVFSLLEDGVGFQLGKAGELVGIRGGGVNGDSGRPLMLANDAQNFDPAAVWKHQVQNHTVGSLGGELCNPGAPVVGSDCLMPGDAEKPAQHIAAHRVVLDNKRATFGLRDGSGHNQEDIDSSLGRGRS